VGDGGGCGGDRNRVSVKNRPKTYKGQILIKGGGGKDNGKHSKVCGGIGV